MLQALETGLVDAVQVVYNIFDQAPEDVLFPACQRLNVAVIARVPFDEGSLTGDAARRRSRGPTATGATSTSRRPTCARRSRVSTRCGRWFPPDSTLPDLALRFILHHPAVSTIIPGMRKPQHVEANLAASDRQALPPELVAALRAHRWERDWKVP